MRPANCGSLGRYSWLRATAQALVIVIAAASVGIAQPEDEVQILQPIVPGSTSTERDQSASSGTDADRSGEQGDREKPAERLKRLQAEVRVLEARLARARAEIALVKAEERLRAVLAANEKQGHAAAPARSRMPAPRGQNRGAAKRTEREKPADRPGREPGHDVVLGEEPEKSVAIVEALDTTIIMPFPDETPLKDVIKYVRTATRGPKLPNGVPIYIEPEALQLAGTTMDSKVKLKAEGMALKRSLGLILKQVGLNYRINNGLLRIDSEPPGPEAVPEQKNDGGERR